MRSCCTVSPLKLRFSAAWCRKPNELAQPRAYRVICNGLAATAVEDPPGAPCGAKLAGAGVGPAGVGTAGAGTLTAGAGTLATDPMAAVAGAGMAVAAGDGTLVTDALAMHAVAGDVAAGDAAAGDAVAAGAAAVGVSAVGAVATVTSDAHGALEVAVVYGMPHGMAIETTARGAIG